MGFVYVLLLLSILLSVAFFTLLEVRLLGLLHLRLGPNKVGLAGYLQPFGDFIKLFKKMMWVSIYSDPFFYFFSPFLGLFVGLSIWLSYVGDFYFLVIYWGPVYFFCLSSFIVFYLLLSGWSSGSLYSSLGSFRSSAQAVSYEVSMIFIMFSLLFFYSTYSFLDLKFCFSSMYVAFMSLPLFMVWLISCLAESGRPPFDFSEGESELVSGFNTEYLAGFFSFIFIAEYSMMLFLGLLTCFFFLGSGLLYLKVLGMLYFYILSRGAFPRLRFDELMMLMWKIILPLVVGGFLFFFCVNLIA